ncbi:hypothetical protein PFISCL1PPCAC_27338 [Pristionchus fissidentatus]|uniref:Uncharacterized protein n=1 Tax=Pristionchus fissidentatus TaxID=1538716 RepID=A0AAV5WVH5_9BILA|nr:hypothetical protein PFISCL1PPCAC_27338 [Pristionchus fissidentatus]
MILLFLLLLVSVTAEIQNDDEYLKLISSNQQWDAEPVIQPRKPFKRLHRSYNIKLFNWTTDMEELERMNSESISIHMGTEDLAIVCKFDETNVVVRLIPAKNAEDCDQEGTIVAYCPDLNSIISLYTETFPPGDYVLTTYSSGWSSGRMNTWGGYCKKGIRYPVHIHNQTLPKMDGNETSTHGLYRNLTVRPSRRSPPTRAALSLSMGASLLSLSPLILTLFLY